MIPDVTPPETKTSHWLVWTGLIALFVLALNYKLVFGLALPQWDAVDQFAPAFGLIADHIKAHHLLMWDPWAAAGSPDLAEPQYGVTSPIILALGFVTPDTQSGFVTYWLVLWVIGAWGMFALAKHLGAPLWGSFLVSLGFATSGFFTGHGEHTPYICSAAYLPALFWRLDAALLHRRLWCAVQAGALYGMSALGGYPAFTILTAFLIAFWTLGRLILPEQRVPKGILLRHLRTTLLAAVITGVLGAVVCSSIYLGFSAHTRGYTDRNGPRSRVESITSNLFPAVAFTTVSSPYLPLLNMNPGGIWPETDVSMCSIYMGSGIVVFALFSLTTKNPWRWWLGGLAVFFACCSVGNELPLRGWLYDYVIPTRYFRNSSDFTIYTILLLAVLAAYGTRELVDSPNRRRTLFLLISILCAAGAIAAFKIIVHVAHRRLDEFRFANDDMFFVWLVVVVLALFWRLNWLDAGLLGGAFIILAAFDAIATIRISQPVLYTDATVSWWHAMDDASHRLDLPTLNRDFAGPASIGNYPNNRNMVLKIPALQSYLTLTSRYYVAFETDPVLSKVATGADRICFSANPVWLKPNDADFARFVARWHEFGTPILALHTPESMQTLSEPQAQATPSASEITRAAVCSPVAISTLSYKPDSLSFSYLASRPGWLLVTDRWAPGWNLRVNGNPRPLTAGDFIFRAVAVQPGPNRIEFTYTPSGFIPLTILGWLVLGIVGTVEIVRFFVHLQKWSSSPAAVPTAH